MTTLSPLSSPLDSLNAMRASQIDESDLRTAEIKTREDTEKVAKNFEALLLHNMLKAMRRTTLGDKPSNERAMYDDMFDQQISKTLSDSGGLGIASSIARQLNIQNGLEDKQNDKSNNMALSMSALSNRESTLSRNSKLGNIFSNVSQYQAMMNQSASQNLSPPSLNGTIDSATLKSIDSIEKRLQFGTKENFIDKLLPSASKSATQLGIQPNVVIAIAALETGWGKHVIKDASGVSSNNLFGIKAHGLEAPYTMHKTTEFVDNIAVKMDAPFRRYESTTTSVEDFADFLLTNPRYEKALEAAEDDHQFIRELQKAGYATDPKYADKAINVLEQINSIRKGPAL